MFDKLDFITEKYNEMALKASDPEVIANQKEWQKYYCFWDIKIERA